MKKKDCGYLGWRVFTRTTRQDVIPSEHRMAVKVHRWPVGASAVVEFRLPEPFAVRTELGQSPSAIQRSLDSTATPAPAD